MHVFSGEDDGIEFEEYYNHLISGLEYNLLEHTWMRASRAPKARTGRVSKVQGRSQGTKRDQAYFGEDCFQTG